MLEDRDTKNITYDRNGALPEPGSEVFQSAIFQNPGNTWGKDDTGLA